MSEKHLVLWAHFDLFPQSTVAEGERHETIEVQDPALALQYLKAHNVSVCFLDSRFGLSFLKQIRDVDQPVVFNLVLDEADLQHLPSFINSTPFHGIFTKRQISNSLISTIQTSILEYESRLTQQQLKRESAKKYRELELLNANLEKRVEEGTRDIAATKLEEETRVNQLRGLIRFIKELAACSSFEELLEILRLEMRKILKIGDPLLRLSQAGHRSTLIYFQNGMPFSVSLTHKTETLEREVMANILSRPVASFLQVQIPIRHHFDWSPKVELLVEHSRRENEIDLIQNFVKERLEPLSITVDRILLEQDHNEKAFRWERTFDGLERPIAILDLDYEIVRSNKNFVRHSEANQKKCYEMFAARNQPCDGCPMMVAFSTNKSAEGTIKVGDRIFQVFSYPIRFGGGKPTNVVNSYVDITQARELYMRLLQSEKLGALGALAGNIAHELNNPLTGLLSLVQVLLHEVPENSELANDLHEIERATRRSQKIITNLQDFSKSETSGAEEFELDETIEKTIPMLKSLLRQHRLELSLNLGTTKMRGEPQLVQQVVFNLINNACQAMKAAGTISVTTGRSDGGRLFIKISDTGPGIPPELQQRIFEPFFTTKAEGLGTGLGLSLSKEIVERHHGSISFQSVAGQGTIFTIQFPEARASEVQP